MYLHEFQAKSVIARYGIPVPAGEVAETPEGAETAARKIGARLFAAKAQVYTGGRGLSGGVRLVDNPAEVRAVAEELLGSRLITSQTAPGGSAVHRIYVEEAIDCARTVYVAALVDRGVGKVALIGVKKGGEDVEMRMARDPSIVETLIVEADGTTETSGYAGFARRLAFKGDTAKRAAALFKALIDALVELDASLIEINPLAVSTDGDLVALDVKMAIDDNALFRHPDLKALRVDDEFDPVELEAQRHEINYVRMDGDIGVVVNGAGLALATHDMLCDAGARPANFMDIRTTASSLDIARGIDLLLANPQVKAILVNIHGGGMQRCDTVAEGIGIAIKRSARPLPLVVRFAGNNADFGSTLLGNYGVPYVRASDMADAVSRIVALARSEAA